MALRAAHTIADFVPVTNPGQLGAAATEAAHARQAQPVPVAVTPGQMQPNASHDVGRSSRRTRLRGGRQLVEVRPEHPVTSVNGVWTGVGPGGAPIDPLQTQEHEPPAKLKSWFFLRRKDRADAPYLGRSDYTDDLDDRQQTEATPADSNTYQLFDERRPTAGHPTIEPARAPLVETFQHDTQSAVVESPQPRPAEARIGDPHTEGRPASVPRWFFFRPYGQQQQGHLTGARGVLGQPGIATPTMTSSEAPGKAPAPGMNPVATPHPNTWRLQPQPWDTDVIDAGTPASAAARRTAFRAGA